jgi:prepilin-type N-terminal cleavage/methylation domain-containing protein
MSDYERTLISRLVDRRRQSGVSLAELLAVVAIIAIIMLAVIPAFGNFSRSWRARAAADEMLSTIRGVRQLAITMRQDITITFTPDPVNTYTYYHPIQGQNVTVRIPAHVKMATNPSGSYAPEFRKNGSVINVSTPTASSPTANYVQLSSVINSGRTDTYTFGFTAAGQVSYKVTR